MHQQSPLLGKFAFVLVRYFDCCGVLVAGGSSVHDAHRHLISRRQPVLSILDAPQKN